MTTKIAFQQNGNEFNIHTMIPSGLLDELPAGTYVVERHDKKGFYLNKTADMAVPEKIYGDNLKRVDRIMRTFEARKESTGVMLIGLKGSGKTMDAKLLARTCISLSMPVLLVNTAYSGQQFNEFLSNIKQECMVFFDEFDKTYAENNGNDNNDENVNHSQAGLLTLLNGTVQGKKLFVFTANEPKRLDDNLFHRPGRIFYTKHYASIEADVALGYIQDALKDPSERNLRELQYLCMFGVDCGMTMDVLSSIVEEVNRYNESPVKAYLDMFGNNSRGSSLYTGTGVWATLTKDDVPLGISDADNDIPLLSDTLAMRFVLQMRDGEIVPFADDEDSNQRAHFSVPLVSEMLVSADLRQGKAVFKNGEYSVELTESDRHAAYLRDYGGLPPVTRSLHDSVQRDYARTAKKHRNQAKQGN